MFRSWWGILPLAVVFGWTNVGRTAELAGSSKDSASAGTAVVAAQESKASCAGEEACASLDACNGERPAWTARADALFLQRVKPGAASAPIDYFSATNPSSFNLDTANGWDLGVVRHGIADSTWDLEGRFFALDSRSLTAGAFPATVLPGGYTVAPYDYSGHYVSGLRNVELNARREVNEWMTFLVGARYLNLNEELDIATAVHFSNNFDITSSRQYTTTNDLLGVQIGLDSHLWSHGRFFLDGIVKAGVFNNSATAYGKSQSSVGLGYQVSASTNHIAFVGEAGLAARYQVTKSWSLRGGYQLLWIEGAALASDQDAALGHGGFFPQPSTVSTDGCPLYHGAFVGLEFSR